MEDLILDIILYNRNGTAEENPLYSIKNVKRFKKYNLYKTLKGTKVFFCGFCLFVSLVGLFVIAKISAKRDMMEAIRFRKNSVGEKEKRNNIV